MKKGTKIALGVIGILIVSLTIVVVAMSLLNSQKYTVSFNVNGGSEVVTQEVKRGDNAAKPIDPVKEGYTFSGWSEAPETMPAHDVEIYGNFFLSSAVDNIDVPTKKSQKVIENNQLFILLPNGKKYNAMGQEL